MIRLAAQILVLSLVVVALVRLYPVVVQALQPSSRALAITVPHEGAGRAARQAQAEVYTPPAFEHFRHALQAPLFYASRRMPARGEVPDAAEALDLRDLRLLGVVRGAHGSRVLMQRAQQPPRWYAAGERISDDGWRIAEVGSGHVVLQKAARRVRLSLFPLRRPQDAATSPRKPRAEQPAMPRSRP